MYENGPKIFRKKRIIFGWSASRLKPQFPLKQEIPHVVNLTRCVQRIAKSRRKVKENPFNQRNPCKPWLEN